MATTLPLLCFNDVYRVQQRYVPQPGAPDDPTATQDSEIRVGQFAELVDTYRDQWPRRPDGARDGLVLFAGDVFSPSVESSVTRGSHMVPVLNALHVDCACVGNHDFDFGYPHMTKLVSATSFPWLLSNVIDSETGGTPAPLHKYHVVERAGVRVGLLGLVEEDWIATIPSWPSNFVYRPMKEVALELSAELRDPKGPHRVDIIIALTHSRVPNDIALANQLGAVAGMDVRELQGVDLLIGGHDHIYYIGKGATEWDGYVGKRDSPSAKDDNGVRLIKSGTDFRDLTSAYLELSPPDDTAVRRRTVTALRGKHNYVTPSMPSSPDVDQLIMRLLATVNKTLGQSVCYTLTPFDARSEVVRTRESSLGNWAADVLLHAYDEALVERKNGKAGPVSFEKEGAETPTSKEGRADAVIICGGTLRGDSQYGPGKITLGDILEIFPFDDAVVCLEIDGKGIWDTIENGLSRWPAQEGRFPVIAGLAVEWDSKRPPGNRVLSIHLTVPNVNHTDDEDPSELVDFVEHEDGTRIEVKQRNLILGDRVENVEGGRVYRVITREYMAGGFDEFDALKGRKMIIDDENGQTMSSIIRSFLLGSAYIYRHKQLVDAHHQYLSAKTVRVLNRAREQHATSPLSSKASSPRKSIHELHEMSPPSSPRTSFLPAVREHSFSSTSTWSILRRHVVMHDWVTIRDAMHIAKHEHMSAVDACEGDRIRRQKAGEAETPRPAPGILVDQARKEELKALDDEVAIVCPLVDGRLSDIEGADA